MYASKKTCHGTDGAWSQRKGMSEISWRYFSWLVFFSVLNVFFCFSGEEQIPLLDRWRWKPVATIQSHNSFGVLPIIFASKNNNGECVLMKKFPREFSSLIIAAVATKEGKKLSHVSCCADKFHRRPIIHFMDVPVSTSCNLEGILCLNLPTLHLCRYRKLRPQRTQDFEPFPFYFNFILVFKHFCRQCLPPRTPPPPSRTAPRTAAMSPPPSTWPAWPPSSSSTWPYSPWVCGLDGSEGRLPSE